LARWTGVQIAEDPATQLLRDGRPVGEAYVQHTVMGQVAHAVFDGFTPGVVLVSVVTGLILVVAANTAFNGFPVLGSILARDGYLPRQLDTRGDRLAFSNGIVLLAIGAVLLILAFDAEVTQLIQLYIVGVFVSFTLSQLGMIRHWTRNLRSETDPAGRRRMIRSRLVNSFGFAMTGTVLLVVLTTKFVAGAWIAVTAMALVFVMMRGIKRHYEHVRSELRVEETDVALPSRVHAIVLVGQLHKPTMRAIAYARVSRPNTIEAVTVALNGDPDAMLQRWEQMQIPIPLKVLDSPYRELVRPVVRYVR